MDSKLSTDRSGARRVEVRKTAKGVYVAEIAARNNSGIGRVRGYGETGAAALEAAWAAYDERVDGLK